MENLKESEQEEIFECILEMMEEYIENNGNIFSKKNYKEIFIEHITNYVEIVAKQEGWYEEDDAYLEDWIENVFLDCLQNFSIPLRESSPYQVVNLSNEDVQVELNRINECPTYTQRTPEWYTQRYNMFSASNIWKLFSTPSQYNSLIYEKCKGINTKKYEQNDVLTPSSLNWGIKYEPVTVSIYEHKNNVRVNTNYGCIPHETLPIGASPDGIVCDMNSEKYGNMVEIKNIYNRDIDGVPSEEYWIQIQTQLEVARLQKCDFVETRIKEYTNKEEYENDFVSDYEVSPEYKGIILFFLARDFEANENCFKYMPLEFSFVKESYEKWIDETEKSMSNTHILYHTSYWYLHEYSCVEVLRNEHWFQYAIPLIQNGWKTVEDERINGYEHRAPQKRQAANNIVESQAVDKNVKVVKLD
jgi:hypothetical protein